MRMIVLRHAARERSDPATEEFREKHLPLSSTGIRQAQTLGSALAGRGLFPSVYFTSCFLHARETAEILRDRVGGNPSAKIVELCALTPHFQGPREWRNQAREWTGVDILMTIDRESTLAGSDFRQLDTVALIMHKPRLEQLLSGMTSRDQSRFRDIEYAGGVYLNSCALDALLQGNGEEEGRISALRTD